MESLTRGNHIGNDSSRNPEISGSLSGRIVKTLIYGEERKSDVDLEVGEIKKAISYFANHVKNGKNWEEKQYREKKEIVANVRKSKSRGSNLRLHWG